MSPGRRFMIDLLVSSLMADGGLESALNAAITAEIQVRPAAAHDPNRGSVHSACEVCVCLRSVPHNCQHAVVTPSVN